MQQKFRLTHFITDANPLGKLTAAQTVLHATWFKKKTIHTLQTNKQLFLLH